MIALLVERGARHHVFSAMALRDKDLVRRVVADDATSALCGQEQALSLEGAFKSFVPTVEADAVAASLLGAIRP